MPARTLFGSEWWTRQWIGALEALGWESRLARGRSYAGTGRVLTLSVEAGRAQARVRGSRPQPYSVEITIDTFPAQVWTAALDLIAAKARYVGQLLAGDMPSDIDSLFGETGRSLFPRAEAELQASCTCPDEANPCKHIAAVHYVLGARFDADPFVLFRLRGMPRERLLAEIRRRRHVAPDQPQVLPVVSAAEGARPLRLEGFHGDDLMDIEPLEIEPGVIDAAAFSVAMPRALAGDAKLIDALVQAGRRAMAAAAEE